MKKYKGYWLKRARLKKNLLQKEVAGDKYTKSYISIVETEGAGLSTDAKNYIIRKLKLPKSFFDNGLFKEEKEELDILTKESKKLIEKQLFNKAEDKVLKGLSVSREAKNDDYINSFLLKLAIINIKKEDKDLKEAEDILSKVNKYYIEEKDYRNLAYSYYWTGVLYREKGNHEEALLIFNKSIEENIKLKRKIDLSLKARAKVKIAQIHRFNENYKAARQKYEEAIDIALKSKDDYIIAMAYFGYALLLQRIGDYHEAIRYYSLAYPIYESLENEELCYQTDTNLASLYHYIGDFDNSIILSNRVFKISEEKNDEKGIAYALLKGAKAKRDKGNLNEGEDDLKRAINIFEKLKDENRMLGEAYMALGLLQEKKKENDLAIKNFNKAVKTFKDVKQNVYINSAYSEIMRFYKEIGGLEDKKIKYILDFINYADKLIDKTKKIIF